MNEHGDGRIRKEWFRFLRRGRIGQEMPEESKDGNKKKLAGYLFMFFASIAVLIVVAYDGISFWQIRENGIEARAHYSPHSRLTPFSFYKEDGTYVEFNCRVDIINAYRMGKEEYMTVYYEEGDKLSVRMEPNSLYLIAGTLSGSFISIFSISNIRSTVLDMKRKKITLTT